MSKLAIHGGKPVRPKSAKWPTWPVSDEQDVKLVTKITRANRWSYDGPVEWDFAKKFTGYTKAKYGMCCANGTVGIQLALEALDIGAYDEVIVPGITWQATASACLDVNAVPILTDVEPDTWCLDLAQVEANITPRTKAVIVVHLYGSMSDMDKLKALCKKHNLFLVEDCAHQHGSFWKDQGVGSLGDVGSFSFQESKTLSSGEGGFNTCATRELFERLYSLRNCGRGLNDDMTHAIHSGNYRLTEWQAALLMGGLRRLPKQVATRDKNAMYLNGLLEQIPGVAPMRRRKEITQQSYFNFAFRIEPAVLDELNVTNAQFCTALSHELNFAFEPPYEPLNKCSLYKPHTKPRYNLSAKYWKQIDPARAKLPVCEDAHFKTGVVAHHRVLMGTKKDMDDVAEAVGKVMAKLDEIKDLAKAERKKYRSQPIG